MFEALEDDSADPPRPALPRPTLFLPPVGPAAGLPGTFDLDLAPVVEICSVVGSECAGPPIARYTTTSGPGAEKVRVDAQEQQYHVNWHTRDFGLAVGATYRVRVLIDGVQTASFDARVVRSGQELPGVPAPLVGVVEGRTLPVKFWVQKVRRLTVVLGDGVDGAPAEQDTLLPFGSTVPYEYGPLRGYSETHVLVDAKEAPRSGMLSMDRDHVVLAGADLQVVLPEGGEELLASAQSVMTARNTVEAFQAHLDRVAQLYADIGPDAAREQMTIIYHVAYDVVEDSAALRRVDEALNNRVFSIDPAVIAEPPPPPSPGMAAGFRAAAAAAAPADNTVFFTINGVFVGYGAAVQNMNETQAAIRETGLQSPVRFYYNSTWTSGQSFNIYVGRCFTDLAKDVDFWDVILLPFRLTRCIVRLAAYPVVSFDLVEAFRQWVDTLGAIMPPEIDARILGDTLRNRLAVGNNVLFVPHSQGNLMLQQALSLQRSSPTPLCVGVTSVAAPSSSPWPRLDPGSVHGMAVKGDGVGDVILLLRTNHFRPLRPIAPARRTAPWSVCPSGGSQGS